MNPPKEVLDYQEFENKRLKPFLDKFRICEDAITRGNYRRTKQIIIEEGKVKPTYNVNVDKKYFDCYKNISAQSFIDIYAEAARDGHYFKYCTLEAYKKHYKGNLRSHLASAFRKIDDNEITFYLKEIDFYSKRIQNQDYFIPTIMRYIKNRGVQNPNGKIPLLPISIFEEIRTSDIAILNYLQTYEVELCNLTEESDRIFEDLAEAIRPYLEEPVNGAVLKYIYDHKRLPDELIGSCIFWNSTLFNFLRTIGFLYNNYGGLKPTQLKQCFYIGSKEDFKQGKTGGKIRFDENEMTRHVKDKEIKKIIYEFSPLFERLID